MSFLTLRVMHGIRTNPGNATHGRRRSGYRPARKLPTISLVVR